MTAPLSRTSDIRCGGCGMPLGSLAADLYRMQEALRKIRRELTGKHYPRLDAIRDAVTEGLPDD